jgi:1-acyl-sn-glycerol-3-phosphate acyltransferase
MAMLKTVVIFIIVGIVMVLLIPLGVLVFFLSCLGMRKPMSVLIYHIARLWALLLIKLTGCKLTVKGRENIPKTGGLCIISNHGSIFDILLALAYIGRPFGFIAKKELLLIPLLNIWIFLLGGLFIDRKKIRNAVRTINKGIERIKSGGGMIIFPEGHRSRGQGVLPFHPGSLKLATQAEAPIVPMALAGSYDVFERNYRVNAVPVTVIFGEPISTADIPAADRKQILADRVHDIIVGLLEQGRSGGPVS